MVLHLVRHACAGQKGEWIGPDDARPLDPTGQVQANALRDALAGAPVRSLWSSPARRCVQTLEPLAEALEVDVARTDRLGAGVDPDQLLALLADPELDGAVLCTHGEAMGALLPRVREGGAVVEPADADDDDLLRKGTVWRLEVDVAAGRVVRLEHLRPSPQDECQLHRPRAAAPGAGGQVPTS